MLIWSEYRMEKVFFMLGEKSGEQKEIDKKKQQNNDFDAMTRIHRNSLIDKNIRTHV